MTRQFDPPLLDDEAAPQELLLEGSSPWWELSQTPWASLTVFQASLIKSCSIGSFYSKATHNNIRTKGAPNNIKSTRAQARRELKQIFKKMIRSG